MVMGIGGVEDTEQPVPVNRKGKLSLVHPCINKHENSHCPYSSVVERATRNGEVGCSIQPGGILLHDVNSHCPTGQFVATALCAQLSVQFSRE